jgi:hypothetical protein
MSIIKMPGFTAEASVYTVTNYSLRATNDLRSRETVNLQSSGESEFNLCTWYSFCCREYKNPQCCREMRLCALI